MHSDFEVHDRALDDAPSFTRHPLRGVVWAAFWGSLVAAGIVMAINYSRMGRRPAAQITAAITVIVGVALFALILAIPEDLNIPNSAFLIPQLIAVYAIANGLQGDQIRKHSAQGGTVASAWPRAVGVRPCFRFSAEVNYGLLMGDGSTFAIRVRGACETHGTARTMVRFTVPARSSEARVSRGWCVSRTLHVA